MERNAQKMTCVFKFSADETIMMTIMMGPKMTFQSNRVNPIRPSFPPSPPRRNANNKQTKQPNK
jgi:hypothetical protein